MARNDLDRLTAELVGCRRCPRLVEWRERVAVERRAAFADQEYWGRPVPGFGDPDARVVIVGLAPAAHGANRTGRMFTGDRSGDWLYASLHRTGFASQAAATSIDDGMLLSDCWITSPVRCAPPANKPTPAERDTCAPWFGSELDLLGNSRVYVCLGRYAYGSLWRHLGERMELPRPRPGFGHGEQIDLAGGRTVLLSYHVSQHNTFTGRLTEAMLDDVFRRAALIAASGEPGLS